VRGWVLSTGVLASLILGWYATPTGRSIPFYPVIHLVALGVILAFREKLVDYLSSEDKGRLTLGAALASFPSTMAGHMLGNLIFIQLFKPEPLFFMTVLPVSAIERGVLTAMATFFSVPLITAVRSLYPDLLE